ncbi:polyprenol reductase-like [Aricia agestis]|uniref:polyprenol reductase-like n=1 Tax=Aricia agestis TaxID=91739 RepID=UPI001C20B6EB|nr:polyprenol reductase-like [Aricia agestis]
MLSPLDIGFISIAAYTILMGYFVTIYEKKLPGFIIRFFKYGSFGYKGSDGGFIRMIEVPKALFKHYYAFSSVFSVLTFGYTILVYVFRRPVDDFCLALLKLVTTTTTPTVSAGACLLTLLLVVIQCCRRYHESHHLQVFSRSARMNISHYMVGFYHYFGVVVAAVTEAPLFSGTQHSNILWLDTRTVILTVPCVAVFAWAWHEQYQSNVILASLRRDKKSGQVVTEEYKIPHGRLFNYVSSPHRFCEIVIYVVLLTIMPTKTFLSILIWVVSNQVLGALYTHDWYKNTFKNYPTNRKAIFPGFL